MTHEDVHTETNTYKINTLYLSREPVAGHTHADRRLTHADRTAAALCGIVCHTASSIDVL